MKDEIINMTRAWHKKKSESLIKTKQSGNGLLYLMSDTNSLLFPTERTSSIMEHYKQRNMSPEFYFQNLYDCLMTEIILHNCSSGYGISDNYTY